MELQQVFKNVKQASRKLSLLADDKIKKVLQDLAAKAIEETGSVLAANQLDLERMDTSDPKYDRLKLTEERIESIAADIQNVANLPSPLGKVLSERSLDNGLELKKVSVPLGVIGIIYEARPNVTFDVFSLCLRSGNALLLKGGSDAKDSNAAIVKLIHEVLEQNGVDKNIVQLLPPDRQATHEMLHAVDYVDIIIPRGSQGLINYVRENSKVPVIETGAGIVHTYFDEFADLASGKEIVVNAKTRRVSVCNALDCLVIHEDRLADLAEIGQGLAAKGVEVFADVPAFAALKGTYPAEKLHQATEEHFGTEFLSLKMSVKTVSGLDEAIEHINTYTSQHSEAIISDNEEHVEHFLKAVDAAAVYANTSTAFTDGAQFGLGAEIGISTQKLHARGPMALDELTSYKWVVKGKGQVRA
ncbi:glutamate-5-semialdehyde dehydrogenase [Pontibacter korlensis]|uniref:Gamma-glutamyl phosphate reductase n=1 Tax=Pontibacter korlensis TaxID=400092 RepID=A0A0E3UYJ3_9BACT|nr:glutamate-5-semialdehyde dehydrogenase [Pontibacter korlensis]AKD04506.1 gamma-glutamyl phosphate reductase [Pontibacter korlensis]